MSMMEDPDDVFSSLVEGIELREPTDVHFTPEVIRNMSDTELILLANETEDEILESDELLLPKSDWAQDVHNLRYALRAEISRRNIAS